MAERCFANLENSGPRSGTRVIPVRSDSDIVEARTAARSLAAAVGFEGADLVMIATAVSEVTRNIIEYARSGEVVVCALDYGSRRGLEIVARDQGPGIEDISRAMDDGYSTSGGLGLGLPGCRRLMDELLVDSAAGQGTIVTMRKWLR